ncbi:MAG: HAD family hydrolase, partial [Actinomycetes bacterium]
LSVSAVRSLTGAGGDELLALAGAVEAASEHPVAHAIARAAREQAPLAAVSDFVSAPGGGVRGTVNGRSIVVGRAGWLGDNGIDTTAESMEHLHALKDSGATVIWVGVNGKAAGLISLTDTIKPGSAAVIARLKELGLRPVLLTGDNASAALAVAAQVGIPAIAAADPTVMGNDLEQVAEAIELSRRTLSTIKTNLFWAFFYNSIGIPVAALGLLNPMIAGAAMAASSVLVVANSLQLRHFGRPRKA